MLLRGHDCHTLSSNSKRSAIIIIGIGFAIKMIVLTVESDSLINTVTNLTSTLFYVLRHDTMALCILILVMLSNKDDNYQKSCFFSRILYTIRPSKLMINHIHNKSLWRNSKNKNFKLEFISTLILINQKWIENEFKDELLTTFPSLFFKVPTINISANKEVKMLSVREGISIQKTIRDRNKLKWSFLSEPIEGNISLRGIKFLQKIAQHDALVVENCVPFVVEMKYIKILKISSGERSHFINNIFQSPSRKSSIPISYFVRLAEFLTNVKPIVPIVVKSVIVKTIRQKKKFGYKFKDSNDNFYLHGVIIDEWEELKTISS
ncbi:hypothetical protein H8356DRAFT_1363189 [Neocallimastix lanati (nom. inval.)]|nr:hypothetical protein H8356DRAFT_1363189 [Neocallimastix sp. JGI-2020a]